MDAINGYWCLLRPMDANRWLLGPVDAHGFLLVPMNANG